MKKNISCSTVSAVAFQPKFICFLVALALNIPLAHAAEEPAAVQRLESVKVTSKRKNIQPPTERMNRVTLENQMIRDTKDLVRYSTDVGIADDGRRTKGFSMRGVEENRVGINVDGVSLPDSEENSLYARYGNFNNSRLSIDSELVRNIEITKGADSFNSGSGALGGSVNYRTLDASDLVLPDKQFGGMVKSGYATKNREWLNTVGVGFRNDKFDAALVYSHKNGHETKNNIADNLELLRRSKYESDYEVKRRAEIGSARVRPDPSKHQNHSYLAKFGWQLTPEQRLGFSLNGQNNKNYTNEYSYALTTYWRNADDRQKRHNINLYHEWTPTQTPLSLIRTELDYQKTENGSINYKGNYRSLGDWRTGYTYEPNYLSDQDFRNNLTTFKRLNIRVDSKAFDVGSTRHKLSAKAFAGQRKFENRNKDLDLNPDGSIKSTDEYTIQYPMKTTQYGVALSDNMIFTPRLSAYLAGRYDVETVKPQDSSLPCGAKTSFGRLCGDVDKSGKHFKNWSGGLGLDYQLNDQWKLGYQASTGYRVPTASELYFSFDSPYGNWLANPNLRSERSLNQSVSLQRRDNKSTLDLTAYHTKYKDFLFEQETSIVRDDPSCDALAAYHTGCVGKRTDYFQQMVNLERATVKGLELKSSLNITPNWKFSGSLGYSKGKLFGDNELSLLSVQPLKAVLGLDYTSPDDKWGIFSRLNVMGAKKAKDAQIAELNEKCREYKYDPWFGKEQCVKGTEYTYYEVMPHRWLNQKAWTFDVFGYYKPTKNLTLRAGVYNLFDTRYQTWDSLRGINVRSTINALSLDEKNAKQGLERYYAPPRNYALSVQYQF